MLNNDQKKIIMIQRFQSLFLLISVIACVLTFFFPLAGFWAEEGSYNFFITGLQALFPGTSPAQINAVPLIAITAFTGLLTLLIIFLYKKRRLQIKMVRFSIMLNIVLILLIFFFYAPAIEKITNADADYTSGIGMYFPIISLVFLILANKYINKDEKLVRSADRLR